MTLVQSLKCYFLDFKFNRKTDAKEVTTTSTSNAGLESETTKSTQIVKSDTTSSLISDTTVQVRLKIKIKKIRKLRIIVFTCGDKR